MLRAGGTIDGYTLVEPLGAGGFGMVWLARDRRGAEVAIKVLHENLIHFETDGKGPSVAERFLAEARILQRLEHPGFVRIFGVIDRPGEGVVAYVMERLVGRDLTKVIRTIALPTLLEIFAQVADTLGVLHAHGIIHRDVKGSNIFVSDPPPGSTAYAVKLLDFGIAKEVHADALLESTATGYFLGTVRSMAPECFQRWSADRPLTGAVDQWSLGVTIFYFLTGRMPFDDASLPSVISQIEQGPPRELRLLSRFRLAEVPLDLRRIIERCMAKLPEDRYPTMEALAATLRGVAGRMDRSQDPTMFDPELARTAADPSQPEHQELQEARRLARSMGRKPTEIDGFGPTIQSSTEGLATELEHPRAGSKTIRTIPAEARPTAPILAEVTKAPKPITGPLVVRQADLPARAPSEAEIGDTVVRRPVRARSGTTSPALTDTRLQLAPPRPRSPKLLVAVLAVVAAALALYLLLWLRAR